MTALVSHYRDELLREIEGLTADKLKQVLDFACFIKAKELTDPSQSYFWTKQWQKMEEKADIDKKTGNIVGDGSLHDLLSGLKQ